MPISAVTVVPLVDVLRSFTQDAAEREGRKFKRVSLEMLGLSMTTAAFCVVFAGLPLPIFVGVLLAVTFGGLADILVFKKMRQFFTSPVKRMAVSNLVATLLGSGIVFAVAFTELLFTGNPMAKPTLHVVVGWLCQSAFIWAASICIASAFGKIKGER
ncbi:hypothetical protein BZG05_14880 [Salinivibrio kushneri]|nr:hypothetical protein BZG05_14880 [Salinivibrio kushneri]